MDSHVTLPHEILDIILRCLAARYLASASLVSRSWRNLMFPHLYRSVHLTFASHLGRFVDLISSEDECASTPTVSTYLRELVLDEQREESDTELYIGEDNLSCLATVVPRLRQLEHFSWDMRFIPRDASVLNALQSECPSLKSVHFTIKEDGFDYYDDKYTQLFNFTDLLHFSLSVYDFPFEFDEDEDYIGPLVLLLRASPRLQSLSLDFRDDRSGDSPWSPATIFTALGVDTVYPALHTLSLLGALNPDWFSFFENPESDPIRLFVSRHPALRTVGFGWVRESEYWKPIEPKLMVELFPCLERLIAPAFICGPVIASELADSLQSLAVNDGSYSSTGLDLEKMAMTVRFMPKLRRLALLARSYGTASAGRLKTLLSAMPFLEDVELITPLDQPEEFTNLLKLVPYLSTLAISPSSLTLKERNLRASQWQDFILTAARECPHLVQFSLDSGLDQACWDIGRTSDGAIRASLFRSTM